jgi:DNA-binding XRE family transcriptional regulator
MRRRDAPKGEQGFNRKIGQRLRELRVLNGLTQTELGQKVGVSYQQVQKYELEADAVRRIAGCHRE